jgi:hypothetical protein
LFACRQSVTPSSHSFFSLRRQCGRKQSRHIPIRRGGSQGRSISSIRPTVRSLLPWTIDNKGAYDYAADTRGYTYDVVVELVMPHWTLRGAEALMPTVANGINMDWRIAHDHADNIEFEVRPRSAVSGFCSVTARSPTAAKPSSSRTTARRSGAVCLHQSTASASSTSDTTATADQWSSARYACTSISDC